MKFISLSVLAIGCYAKTIKPQTAEEKAAQELKACQTTFKDNKWCCAIKEDYLRLSYADCIEVKEGEEV